MVGGAVLVERPRQSVGACAERVRRRAGDLPVLRCTGHRAVGSGGHRTNVDGGGRSGSDGATGAALHSVAHWSWLWSCAPVSAVPSRGLWYSPGSALRAGSADLGELLVWPVTLDISGSGAGTDVG
jgi:hypothetical protein